MIEGQPKRYAWWKQKSPKEAGESISAVLDTLMSRRTNTHERWLRFHRAYLGRGVASLSPADYANENSILDASNSETITKNLIESQINTIVSHTYRAAPRIVFQARGADPKLRKRVKQLNKFCVGIQDYLELRHHGRHVLRQAALYGCGIWRTRWDAIPGKSRAEIKVDVVLPWSIYYDPTECQAPGQQPRSLYQTSLVDRDWLLLRYPEHADYINDLPVSHSLANTAATTSIQNPGCNQVRIVEAWHLPSMVGADDGCYSVAIKGMELYREEWEHERFPHSAIMWNPAPTGFWLEAKGLAEQCAGHQRRLDNLVSKIDRNFDMAPSICLLPKDSGIDEEKLTNEAGFPIHTYNGEAPVFFNAEPLHPQYLQQERQTISDAYDFTGISQAAATARKPTGVESGVALQHLSDEASVRFMEITKDYNQLFADQADCTILAAKSAQAAGYRVESVSGSAGFSEVLSWADVNLDVDKLLVTGAAVTNHPRDLAGQIDLAQNMVNSGLYPREYALNVITDVPDNESATALWNAHIERVEMDVDAIISDGESRLPDSQDDVNYAREYARRRYLMDRDRLDDDAKANLLQYIAQAEALIAAMQPPMPIDPTQQPGPEIPA